MKMIMISAVALSVLGTTLYQVKTGIDERQDRLRVLEAELKMTKRDIAILEAEWAYLSRPERVTELSGRLLNMEPIGQDRILPLDSIPMRLLPEFDSADKNSVTQFDESGTVISGPSVAATSDAGTGLLRRVSATRKDGGTPVGRDIGGGDAALSDIITPVITPVPHPARAKER